MISTNSLLPQSVEIISDYLVVRLVISDMTRNFPALFWKYRCESCVSAWFGSVLQSARGGKLRCPAGCGGEVSGFPAVSVHLRNDIKARFGELR
jgi:hypothetical protein